MIRVTTTEESLVKVTAADLRKALDLPPGAKLIVKVPTGGDYSGMDLDLEEHPILASWSRSTTQEGCGCTFHHQPCDCGGAGGYDR